MKNIFLFLLFISSLGYVNDAGVLIDDSVIFYRPSNAGYSTSSYDNFPIWINSGTKDLIIGRTGSTGPSYKLSISAIEYNTA